MYSFTKTAIILNNSKAVSYCKVSSSETIWCESTTKIRNLFGADFLRGENETTEFNHNAHRIRLLSRGYRIESTKCAPLLALIIGLYRVFYLRDPNEILDEICCRISPYTRFLQEKNPAKILSFKGYIWLIHPL